MELYHYGVKGQRWGVRRYQNKDGTLTAAGKQHYRTDKESDDALASRNRADLYNDIRKKSGDLYNGSGLSSGVKRATRNYENELNKVYNSKRTPAVDAHEKAQAELNSYVKSEFKKRSKGKLDELRKEANRQLEANDPEHLRTWAKYNAMFSRIDSKISKTREYKQLNAECNATLKRAQDDYRAITDEVNKARPDIRRQFEQELASVVLTDLGYRDTKTGRQYLLDQQIISTLTQYME